MYWQDDGIIINTRLLGDQKGVITLLTPEHGLYHGVASLGIRKRHIMQPGTPVRAQWQARISQHLGQWRLEARPYNLAPIIMENSGALNALSTICALLYVLLPERLPYPKLYYYVCQMLDKLTGPIWARSYIDFELLLLQELGFGLDLSQCTITKQTQDLQYVSPRSGRAVTREAGAAYKDKLLPLPDFLNRLDVEPPTPQELEQAFGLTQHFIERMLLSSHRKPMPAARKQIISYLIHQISKTA